MQPNDLRIHNGAGPNELTRVFRVETAGGDAVDLRAYGASARLRLVGQVHELPAVTGVGYSDEEPDRLWVTTRSGAGWDEVTPQVERCLREFFPTDRALPPAP